MFPGVVRGVPARGPDPGSWNTRDGWITYRALWAWHGMIPAAQAVARFSAAQAVRMGFGGEETATLHESTEEAALPE